MANEPIRPSRWISPEGNYQPPRQPYRRPGSDLSAIPSRLEQTMERQRKAWTDMTSDERREAVLELVRERPRKANEIVQVLKPDRRQAVYNLLNSLLNARRIARSYADGGWPSVWHLPGQAPQNSTPEPPAPASNGEAKPETPPPETAEEAQDPPAAPREPKAWIREYLREAEPPIDIEKVAITDRGTLLMWIEGTPTEYSAATAKRLVRLLNNNLVLIKEATEAGA